MKEYIAVDLGASNGRTILGRFDGQKLTLRELNRFENNYIRVGEQYYWDALHLFACIKDGLKKYAKNSKGKLIGIGIDTWGVDFGLLDCQDNLIGNPYHYRDKRTDEMMASAFKITPRDEIYDRTGIQFMQLNSLYQLLAMAQNKSVALSSAARFLNMPDLFNFFLTIFFLFQ